MYAKQLIAESWSALSLPPVVFEETTEQSCVIAF